MEPRTSYTTNSASRFDHLELIDVKRMVIRFDHKKFIQTLTTVNDSALRICIVKGETQWHKNEDDEFLFVFRGRLYIDFESKTIEVRKNKGITIPKGLMYRTKAPRKVVLLRLEPIGVKSTLVDENRVDPINQKIDYTYPQGISLNTPVQELRLLEGLSVRSINVCLSVNVTTLKELLEFQKEKLNNFAMVKNCGRMSDRELVNLYEKYKNYCFPEVVPLS